MATITATLQSDGLTAQVKVTVQDASSSKQYRVGVPEDIYKRITQGKISKEECAKAAFRFLLDRESKESILSQFDLPVINQYFPEFESKFKDYL